MSCLSDRNCENASESELVCSVCKYSFENLDHHENFDSHYKPLKSSEPHKQDAMWAKEQKRLEAQTIAGQKKIAQTKLRKRADKTENVVFKTLNSGRVNKDGDLSTERLTIDVKLQTTTLSPKIDRGEWLKVQDDAKRALKDYGVLAIVNRIGETFYVIPEEMFKEMIAGEHNV